MGPQLRRFWFVLLLAVRGFALPAPVLLDKTLPDIPECRDVLTQRMVEHVRNTDVDPIRVMGRSLNAIPPTVACQSRLWRALRLRAGLFNAVKTSALLDLRAPRTESGQFWGPNVPAAGGVTEYQGETTVALDRYTPTNFVAGANSFYRDPNPNCQSPTGGAAKTFGTQALYLASGNMEWTYRCAPWPATLTGSVPNADTFFGSDPAVAWGLDGKPIAAYMLIAKDSVLGTTGAAIVVAKYDWQSGWQPFGTVVDHLSDPNIEVDKEMIAVDLSSSNTSPGRMHRGRVYVIYDQEFRERVAHSDDGASWTTVELPRDGEALDKAGDVKVGNDGTVYATWNRFTGGETETTLFSKSIDGGNTWSAPVAVAEHRFSTIANGVTIPAQDERSINAFASLGVDGNPASPFYGRLYVAFCDYPGGVSSGTNTNVYAVTSADDGGTWSAPQRVNDDAGSASQFFPWLAIDYNDGTVNVSWYDTRNDPDNRKTQQFYARSSNGGSSFETNVMLTDGGSAWTNHLDSSDESTAGNPARNANQYGDYSGIAAGGRRVVSVWTDSRNLVPNAGQTKEDLAATMLQNCTFPGTLREQPSASVGASCDAPSVTLSWGTPFVWGIGASGGTYSIYRTDGSYFPIGSTTEQPIAAASETYPAGTWHYQHLGWKVTGQPKTLRVKYALGPGGGRRRILLCMMNAPADVVHCVHNDYGVVRTWEFNAILGEGEHDETLRFEDAFYWEGSSLVCFATGSCPTPQIFEGKYWAITFDTPSNQSSWTMHGSSSSNAYRDSDTDWSGSAVKDMYFVLGNAPLLATGISGTTFTDSTGIPGNTYRYRVDAINNCPGTELTPLSTPSNEVSITFPTAGPSPAATVSGGATIAPGGSTTISATLTGTPPWIVKWSDGVTQQDVGDSPLTRSVSPATSTTYTVDRVSDAHCIGSASGNAVVNVVLDTPASLIATASGTSAVNLTWNAVAGADHYEVRRGASTIATPSTPSFSDSTVGAKTSYLYRVRAVNGGVASAWSAPDLATTVAFTDDPLVAHATRVKSAHLSELRDAANALRALAGFEPFAFTDPDATVIRAIHFTQLRSVIDAARGELGLAAMTWTNELIAQTTPIRAVDATELRQAVR